MENVTPEQKQPVIKTLAIAGLVGIIIFAAWLAIQIVQVFPTAASSLASLAQSVYTFNPSESQNIELASGQTMVNVGEPFTISWKPAEVPGVYTFTYECKDGISVAITAGDSQFAQSACEQPYDLGTNTALSLTIASEKERFAEVPYTINFFRTNATAPTASYNSKVTVVNANLYAVAPVATTTTEVVTEETPTEPVPPEVAPVVPEPVEPPPVVPAPTEPVVTAPTPTTPAVPTAPTTPAVTIVPEYIYEIPVSQADGQADLLVSYLGFGIIDRNGTFIKTEMLTEDVAGALQFSVHNIGNKTSEDWTFTATLPGDLEFTSNEQDSLLPNERAVLTLTFKAVTEPGTENYGVTVMTTRDRNTNNNSIGGIKVVTR